MATRVGRSRLWLTSFYWKMSVRCPTSENPLFREQRSSRLFTCPAVFNAGIAVGKLGVRVVLVLESGRIVFLLRRTVRYAVAAVIEMPTRLQQQQQQITAALLAPLRLTFELTILRCTRCYQFLGHPVYNGAHPPNHWRRQLWGTGARAPPSTSS